jgi:hypothetical protein
MLNCLHNEIAKFNDSPIHMRKERVKLWCVLFVFMFFLCPLAMGSGKIVTVACYAVTVLAAVSYAISNTKWSIWLLWSSSGMILLTMLLPLDIETARGSSVGLGFHRISTPIGYQIVVGNTTKTVGDPDLSLGVKTRWVLRISLP